MKKLDKSQKNSSEDKKKIRIIVVSAICLFVALLMIATFGSTSPEAHTNKATQETSKEKMEEEKPIENEALLSAATDPNFKNGEKHKITRVIDGDTIETAGFKVRMIGLDTPETKHPSKPVQCFGAEASAKMTELALNKEAYFVTDSSQGETDKYGRRLYYVYLEDGTNIAYQMIRDGFGHEYTYNSNPHKWQKQFKDAQNKAREGKQGLWADSACGGNTDQPKPKEAQPQLAEPAPAQQPRNGCNIKGNINKRGQRIYHVPGQKYYNKTHINELNGEKIFCSEQEAINAGWRKSKV